MDADALVERISGLVEQARAAVAAQANVALTLTNWHIGKVIDAEVLQRRRAGYGKEVVAAVAQQLTARYGSGFDLTNLYRMVQLAQAFPDEQIVASLGQQLSWTHFKALLPLKSAEARRFYAEEAAARSLTVRELRHVIARKAYERRDIADSQITDGSAVPLDTFRDPMLLDVLGLKGTYQEQDLEEAVIREMEPFLLEVGQGWTFVTRQKRMTVDGDDFYLDLLFFSRPLHRLVAVELKLGKFKAAYEGQMKLYLKWLDRYERQAGEEAPIGLILCTEARREQIELLQMHKDGIAVAEYWTDLPPKKELEERIQLILRQTKERLARRELPAALERPGTSDLENAGNTS
ncbi:MAG: PDDEXK nuclease domain-containing protein [Micrococcales bacterium]|nr:PDDEXK nuclease domain-containing protein [Micrococcales bacterium]